MTATYERGWIAWFVKNPVAANILMATMLACGIIALFSIKREVMPSSDSYMISVTVAYPGASPEETEEGICKRIENEIFGLEGVKRITARADEGLGAVTLEVFRDYDVREVLDEVKSRIDAIDNFPENARKPLVREVTVSRMAVTIAISGDTDELSLKHLGEEIRDDLTDLPQITSAELSSARNYEISIEVSEAELRRYGLTIGAVADAIRRASIDVPGGSVKTRSGEIMLRGVGQRYTGAEFESIVLRTRADGTELRLTDVGRVVDGFADSDDSSRFDGKRSVLVQVFRVGDQDAIDVVAAARAHIEKLRSEVPEGIELTLWADDTVILRSRIDLLSRNLLSGLALVFLTLAIFLRFKLAFWVSLGIPTSFFAAAALMPMFDISVNMISLFAFLMVLGIVVDDAIVIGESIHSHRKDTPHDGVGAAIRGAHAVRVPVTFGVLTTMAAFTPMLNMSDNMAKLWHDIGLIVMFCLLFSLVESKLILPMHLAHSTFDATPKGRIPKLWYAFRSLFTGSLDWFVDRIYQPLLDRALRWRYVTATVAVCVFALTISLVATGYIKRIYFPAVEGDNVAGTIEMPQGTPASETKKRVDQLERAALEIRDELAAEGRGADVEHILASVGSQPFNLKKAQMTGSPGGSGYNGSHLGEVNVQLAPAETRSISATEFSRRWRKKTGRLTDVDTLAFDSDMVGSGADIDIQLAGEDIDELSAAAEALKRHLASMPGVSEIADSFRGGKQEVQLRIHPSAENLGLTQRDLATQVRQAFYGEEVQRIQRKGEDMRVMVRYPESERNTLATLESMRIRTPQGAEVPFHTVADATLTRGFATISRSDRARTIDVTAEVDQNISPVSPNEIVASLVTADDGEDGFLPQLMQAHPTLTQFSFEGDNRNQAETQKSLIAGFSLVLFLIYGLLAIPLKSYIQPLLVMSAIPFGFLGGLLGHWIIGLELSIMSMFGFIALTGVVINDNLVLIDFINRKRREGVELLDAVAHAGAKRFRPILLTSLTTTASLTPLLMERSVQAMFLIPMAVSLAFGVLFATAVSLVFVPSGYLILHDVLGLFRRTAKPDGETQVAVA